MPSPRPHTTRRRASSPFQMAMVVWCSTHTFLCFAVAAFAVRSFSLLHSGGALAAARGGSACSLFWKDRCQSYRGRKPDSLQTLKCGPALAKALCVDSTYTHTNTHIRTHTSIQQQQRASNGGRKQASKLLSLASPAKVCFNLRSREVRLTPCVPPLAVR